MRCIVYKSYLSGSGHLLVFCPHEGDVLLMLGCSTDLDNLDRRVCRSVDGEREKNINSVFYSYVQHVVGFCGRRWSNLGHQL